MRLAAESSLPSTLGPPEPGRFRLNRWIIVITVIGLTVTGGLFTLIYYTGAQVSSKTFSYTPPQDSQGSYNSISIADVDGPITLVPWSRPTLLINGTMTARGLGSSLSSIYLSNATANGNIVFQAVFAVNSGFFFSQRYTVAINIYIPSTIRLASVHVSNTNGGVRIESLNSTNLILSTVNGAMSINCLYCLNVTATSTNGNISAMLATVVNIGSYNLTSTNAGVTFSVPASSSFELDASAPIGSVQVIGFPGRNPGPVADLITTFGTDGASVGLKSVNGQITIQGT